MRQPEYSVREHGVTPCKPIEALRQHGLKPPRILTIAITNDCNLACKHCWVKAGGLTAPAHVPERLLEQIISEFAALGGSGLRITGGEPLNHPSWLKLMNFSRSIEFQTLALQTNGMHFTDNYVSALRELDFPGLSIQISLDGATASTHDLVRGTGAFTGTLDGILKLVQEGLAGRISLFMTEMHHNLEDIPALLEFADNMGIGSFSSGALVVCGRASEGDAVSPPGRDQYLRLLDRYDTDQRFRQLYQKIGTISALEWREDSAVRNGCCSFIENPYITHSGRIYPCLLCHTDDFSVSGVYEKGLANALIEGAPLWSSLHRISQSRAEAISECRDCPGRHRCAGGCMGRAWKSCGGFHTADDRCETRRAIYQHARNSLH